MSIDAGPGRYTLYILAQDCIDVAKLLLCGHTYVGGVDVATKIMRSHGR